MSRLNINGINGINGIDLSSLSSSLSRSISQSNIIESDNDTNNDTNNTNDTNNDTANVTTNNDNDLSSIFPMIRSRFFYPLILFILIKLIFSFLPKLLCYLLLYLYVQKTNNILREKLTLKGIKRITSLLSLLLTTIVIFTISITFMEMIFNSNNDVSITKRLVLYNHYNNINIIDLFWYILITDIVVSAITLSMKIFIFTLLLLNGDIKSIISSVKMSFANLRKFERKNSENLSLIKDNNSSSSSGSSSNNSTPIGSRRCLDDVENGIDNNMGRRRRTVSSVNPDIAEVSSVRSDSSVEYDSEMKRENLQQIFLKKIASIIDLVSLIYRTIIVTPFWVAYLRLGSGGQFITSFYIIYKITDSIRKCCALYETVGHFVKGTIEFGHTSTPLEIQTCDGCPICFDQIPDLPVTLSCGHTFCTSCIYEWFDRQQKTCPTCRQEIKSESSILRTLREDGILDNMVLI